VSRRSVIAGMGVVVGLLAVAVLLSGSGGDDGFGLVAKHASASYVGVALLVFLDALCPVFPGETTLNAASTLAASGRLELWLVMVAGAVGAVAGDSALYWIARLFSGRLSRQVRRARQNDTVALALGFLGDNAPLLLIAGRFVPGLRFVVNSTLGTAKYPYPRFVLWSAVGGGSWSVYTCLLAYAVGTALQNFPLASVAISGVITTALVAVIVWRVRSARQAAGHESPDALSVREPHR
jgi:membrane protein DedA with SNARE-associated domain